MTDFFNGTPVKELMITEHWFWFMSLDSYCQRDRWSTFQV